MGRSSVSLTFVQKLRHRRSDDEGVQREQESVDTGNRSLCQIEATYGSERGRETHHNPRKQNLNLGFDV